MSAFDGQMIAHAKARGPVLVTQGQRCYLATLVAWRPRRTGDTSHRNIARVESHGNVHTVPLSRATVVIAGET